MKTKSRKRLHQCYLAVLTVAAMAAALPAMATLLGTPPIIIAHRGASGYLPEETLESYILAVQLRADFIEPDLWLSKDGVLVARHDGTLNPTTNVATYALTHPAILALGTGNPNNLQYAISDFTFAQIQELTATRRNAAGFRTPDFYYDAFPPGYDFNVMSLNGVLDYAYQVYLTTGRIVGVEPEAKATGYEQMILDTLNDPKYNGFFDGHLNNIILQSFNLSSVAYWNSHSSIPSVYLTTCPSTAAAMQTVAQSADGIGISLSTRTSETTAVGAPATAAQITNAAAAKACADRAHAAGLIVQAYTFYDIPADYDLFLATGIDGVFSNFADVGVRERNALFGVPEPGTIPLLAGGLLGLFWLSRRRAPAHGGVAP